jgi:hypothetical protein
LCMFVASTVMSLMRSSGGSWDRGEAPLDY